MQSLLKSIAMQADCKYLLHEPLARHSTWRVGGPAEILFLPGTVEQCVNVLDALYNANIAYQIIGAGSNILVGDKGYRGAVIKLSELKSISFDKNLLSVEAGVSLPQLAIEAGKKNLSGLEFAAGIPGTVGGAVKMNAGAEGGEIANVFSSALCWCEGEVKNFNLDEMHFSYRSSVFKSQPGVILKAEFKLEHGDWEKISKQIKQYIQTRKTKQPLEYPNAGSVFKNPPNNFAGKLIAEAGLKGKTVGGAMVSPKHANFIVNTKNATASDIKNLIQEVQKEVALVSGVYLEPEVEFIGDF